MKRPIIFDCDPGHDDAIALFLAIASERFDIRAVTVVAGNQTLDKTLYNALRVLTVAGCHPPVAAGRAAPLLRPLQTAPSVHGETGLDGPDLPEPAFEPEPVTAVELMVRLLEEATEPITILATGPLTNVALLLLLRPDLKAAVREIVIMGGAIDGGNWQPAAEFNILVDPEAASIVFNAGLPLTMCGLDVTHRALITPDEARELRDIGGPVGPVMADILDFFMDFHLEQGFPGAPVHDATAVAYLLNPAIFTTRMLPVEIETQGRFTAGETVADRDGVTGRKPNVKVCFDIDREAFARMIKDAARYYCGSDHS